MRLLVWHDEVQQCPQLLEGVLQWCAGDEHPVVRLEIHQRAVQQ